MVVIQRYYYDNHYKKKQRETTTETETEQKAPHDNGPRPITYNDITKKKRKRRTSPAKKTVRYTNRAQGRNNNVNHNNNRKNKRKSVQPANRKRNENKQATQTRVNDHRTTNDESKPNVRSSNPPRVCIASMLSSITAIVIADAAFSSRVNNESNTIMISNSPILSCIGGTS